MRHPPTGQEAVADATADECARSDDNDGRCADAVAEGFAATGGAARGADLFEQRMLGINAG